MFILYLIVLIGAIGVGFFNRKELTSPYKIVWILLLFTWFSEMGSHYMKGINPKWIYAFYAVVSSLLYAVVFRYLLLRSYRRLWQVGTAVMLIFFALELSNLNSVIYFPSILITFSSPILIIFSLALFNQIIIQDKEIPLWQRPEFVFNAIFIVYISINFTHLAFYDYFIQHKFSKYWSQQIHTWSSVLYYMLLGYLFYVVRKSRLQND